MSSPIRLYMSMSLDGFIAEPDDRQGEELGPDAGRLFSWLSLCSPAGSDNRIRRHDRRNVDVSP
jgi:hypothetical protein